MLFRSRDAARRDLWADGQSCGSGIFHIRLFAGGGANSATWWPQTVLHLLRVYGKSLESSQWPPAHRPLLAAEYSRRKKNVWYQGAALLIQRRGIKNSQAKIPGSLEYSGWRRIRTALAYDRKTPERICSGVVVDGEGFEPSKASPADLQSVPFGHSGIHP